jgi:hypothetical protein
MKSLVILALLLLPFVSHSAEMDDQTVVEIPQGWAINFQLGLASLNPELISQGIGDSASSFGLSFDKLNDDIYMSFLINVLNLDDNEGYSEEVVGTSYSNSGQRSTAKSNASASLLGAALGKAWFVNNNKAMLYAQGGFNFVAEASRNIPNCSNCGGTDLNIDSGLFTRFGANIFLDNAIIGVFSIVSLTGDIDNNFGISVGFQY